MAEAPSVKTGGIEDSAPRRPFSNTKAMKRLAAFRYALDEHNEIASGPHARVFRWRDPEIGDDCALKAIPRAAFGNTLAAFLHEAEHVFAEPHPNVVAPRYVCTEGSAILIATPFYARGSLASRISAGPLALGRTLRLTRDVLAGLSHIHKRGFLHLDLVPTNVLVSDLDVAMLADFGQARESADGTVRFSPACTMNVPPEVLKGRKASEASDVYQAGLVLYRAVNGEPFYLSQVPRDERLLRSRIASGKFPNRADFMPHVPNAVRAIIQKALSTDARSRYQCAADLAGSLAEVSVLNDWETSIAPSGATTWQASRSRDTRLEVVMEPHGKGWSAGLQTLELGDARAEGRRAFWRTGLSRSEAVFHLKRIFENLE